MPVCTLAAAALSSRVGASAPPGTIRQSDLHGSKKADIELCSVQEVIRDSDEVSQVLACSPGPISSHSPTVQMLRLPDDTGTTYVQLEHIELRYRVVSSVPKSEVFVKRLAIAPIEMVPVVAKAGRIKL